MFLNVGDDIEVIRLPDGRPYLRNDARVSAVNFAYNGTLLALEVGVAVTMAVGVIRKRSQATNAT